ncbi:probable glutathione S-transferase GSTU6 [Lolium rigidum]|uniref:probable glutathione S-transferase GSTU6 n=1 Tax=Lolium rigidum TaxID=89674 RepID=UPI001F5D6F5F|nr:probable glutathione S-transferase GSTU6 [Lolium rigidum]
MAGEGDLKLLGLLVSPFVVRVRMALSMKGVSYEYIEQDVFNKSELLIRYNPVHQKVPVLIHHGKPICESLAIVEYVDEVWGGGVAPSILPADPYERAIARFWAAYIDDKLFPAWMGVLKAATEEEKAEKVSQTLAVLVHLEEAFAKCSDGKAFFGGDTIGYLDLALGCNLFWFKTLRKMFNVELIEEGRTPLLASWAQRFSEAAAVKDLVPNVDKAVEHAKKMRRVFVH